MTLIRITLAAALLMMGCGGDDSSSSDQAEPVETQTAGAEGDESPALPTEPLRAGVEAPDFTALDQAGTSHTLSSLRGQLVVLYFYPRDATPGCTVEACAFRDAWAEYEERGIQLFGVSVDDVESHRAFAAEHELPFPLLADTDHAITDAYGVRATQGETLYSRRVTYFIDDAGVIRHVFEEVDPGVHSDEVLQIIDAHVVMGRPEE